MYDVSLLHSLNSDKAMVFPYFLTLPAKSDKHFKTNSFYNEWRSPSFNYVQWFAAKKFKQT